MQLDKNVFFITGCASGIGRRLMQQLVQRGDRVFATDLRIDILTAEVARNQWPDDQVRAHALDVRDPKAWKTATDAAIHQFGQIDILMNVAGYLQPRWIRDIQPQEVDLHFDVNTKGTIHGTQVISTHMIQRGKGQIINLASIAGLVPLSGMSLYSASKYAVRAFSLAAANELKPYGVSVSVVCPDGVRTPMLDFELDFEEAAMVFSGSRVLTIDELTHVILTQVLEKKPLEVFVPPSRGWLARLGDLFPDLFFFLEPLFRRRGRAYQAKLKRERNGSKL